MCKWWEVEQCLYILWQAGIAYEHVIGKMAYVGDRFAPTDIKNTSVQEPNTQEKAGLSTYQNDQSYFYKLSFI